MNHRAAPNGDQRPQPSEPAGFDSRPLLVVSIALLVTGLLMEATPPTTVAVAVMVPAALALLALWAYHLLGAAREFLRRLGPR